MKNTRIELEPLSKGRGYYHKAVYRRDSDGNIKRYESIRSAIEGNNTTSWTIRQLCNNGKMLYGQYHFSYDVNDWSHCNAESSKAEKMDRGCGTYVSDLDAKIKQFFTQRAQYVEMPEQVQQPQTQEDWEAMKQRAMQPFVCSLTDEGMRKHEEEVRKRSIAAMREKSYDNCTLERATRTNIYSEV